MNYQPNMNMNTTIKVARLVMMESGTYNPMFNRPYYSHITGDIVDSAVRRVEEATELNGVVLAGVAHGMMQPQAVPGAQIQIPYGWAERRIRFMMEVHINVGLSTDTIFYFQGYTSFLGVSAQSGAISPEMDFIINSYIRVIRTQMTGASGVYYQDQVAESAQVIDGRLQAQHFDTFMMRPVDIFTGMQSNHLESTYNYYNTTEGILDTRIRASAGSHRSTRANNLAGNYIANVIDGYRIGSNTGNAFGQVAKDIYGQCRNFVPEHPLSENRFIRALSNITGIPDCTRFKMADLMKIDPNVPNVTNFVSQGVALAQSHHAGQTEYWNGANRDTVVATTLSNAIPALMMEYMISKVVLTSTNHDMGSRINTVIIDAKSLTNIDMIQYYEQFKSRFEKEIIMDITYGNQEAYALTVEADLFGDTKITISMGGNPPVTYTTPSFCDGLLTPVIATTKDHFYSVVNDFESLVNHLNPVVNAIGFNAARQSTI